MPEVGVKDLRDGLDDDEILWDSLSYELRKFDHARESVRCGLDTGAQAGSGAALELHAALVNSALRIVSTLSEILPSDREPAAKAGLTRQLEMSRGLLLAHRELVSQHAEASVNAALCTQEDEAVVDLGSIGHVVLQLVPATRLTMVGHLSLGALEPLQAVIRIAVDAGSSVTVDLRQVTFMDSAPMLPFLALATELEARGLRLIIICEAGPKRESLRLSGFDSRCDIRASLAT